MPVEHGQDRLGPFYRWGAKGAKYYYEAGSQSGRALAHAHAALQGRAIHARKYAR